MFYNILFKSRSWKKLAIVNKIRGCAGSGFALKIQEEPIQCGSGFEKPRKCDDELQVASCRSKVHFIKQKRHLRAAAEERRNHQLSHDVSRLKNKTKQRD
jgi:hypothetical protein